MNTLSTQRQTARRERPTFSPPVDIYENGDEFLIVADLPGVKQDDVRIHYERGRIDLQASANMALEQATLIAGQELSGDYRRSFSVPGTIDVEKISADLKSGVLYLHLPKSERAKPRQIKVRSEG
jgi:HSP20 family molecular chaperone IbpA